MVSDPLEVQVSEDESMETLLQSPDFQWFTKHVKEISTLKPPKLGEDIPEVA